MATTRITPDNDAVISEIEIAAPPERVFQALIERGQAMQWGTNDAFEMTFWEMDARPGGKWRFVSSARKGPGAGKDYDHHGEIVEMDPPRVLAYCGLPDFGGYYPISRLLRFPERFFVYHVRHLRRVAAIIILQHVDQPLNAASRHAFVGIGREARDAGGAGEMRH
jgi:hypothetical protein